ncbi:MAG: cadherin-like domain-containing protein [Hyphomicrobiaceae bacterium]|nr:cadherin-like domain-containing protein [Hyphomicrobiaceae bacterium]
MSNIRLERLPIQKFFLGYLGFDHLQLTFEQDSLTEVPIPQDEWFVMEGLRQTTADGVKLTVAGDSGNLTLQLANGGVTGDALEALIGTPETRGSRILSVADPDATWSQMAAHAANIDDQYYDYNAIGSANSLLPTLNSTSFIASVLYAGGIDITTSLPRNVRMSPGMETLLGGNGDDHLTIQNQFTALYGGAGEDLLQGINETTRIDRMYGGSENDLFGWSQGKNYLHGGDTSWAYKDDGIDTVNYSGAGGVHIEIVPGWVEHKTPQYIATFNGGLDYLLSIERLVWDDSASDVITTGPGVELIETPLSIYLGSEGAATGRGDTIDFSQSSTGLNITHTSTDAHFVVAASGQKGEGGIWIEQAEWIVGSSGDDKIFANIGLRGIEGGDGSDFIDARLVEAFSGASPQGYDVELIAGEGSDTLISNAGRTFINGDAGADIIVASAITSTGEPTEIVIENADASDKLYIPYNYFNESGGDYDQSPLMQIVGAIGLYEEMTNYGWELFYENRLEADIWANPDEIAGVINFAGDISFYVDQSDLVITVFQAERLTEEVVIDDAGNTQTRHSKIILPETETTIRVVDFQPGDLGLQFIDPGDFSVVEFQGRQVGSYENWDAAVAILNPVMLDAFPEAPSTPAVDPNDPANAPPSPTRHDGTENADFIAVNQPTHVNAGAGDDTIIATGANNDTIDGGTGADEMAGGEGDDHYFVDNPGDTVVENPMQGIDTVAASLSYTLAANVENLSLIGSAANATGNALANQLVGTAGDNTLVGLDGNDTLFGGQGDDLLIGGEGSDTYTFLLGDGNDLIVETGTGTTDIDTIQLFENITPADISALQLTTAPSDLMLVMRGSGSITLADAFGPGGITIERLNFDDGTVWSTADILALAQTASTATSTPPTALNDYGLVYGGSDHILSAAPLLANDSDPGGGLLTLQSVYDPSVGSALVTPGGEIALTLPEGFEGKVTFRYTVANESGATASALAEVMILPNTAPVAAMTLADQTANSGEAWTYTLPAGLFTDPDGDMISYHASLADGSALPGWLNFNQSAQTFYGTPPTGSLDPIELRVEAYDGFAVSSQDFTLTISGEAPDTDQTIAGTSGNDSHVGGSGNDTFTVLGNDTGYDTYNGGAGIDTISGSPWNDTIGLANVAGNLTGIEIIDGGDGNDRLKLTAGDDTLDLTDILVTSVELIDAGAGNDIVTGSAGNDTIRAGAGDDWINGGDGNDTFTIVGGGEGFDVFVGGGGSDTILGSPWADTIALANVIGNLDGIETIDGGDGYDTVKLTTGDDSLDLSAITLTSIELIDGGTGNDTITGSWGNDTIRAGAGNDHVDGGGGNDTFTIVGNAEGFDVFIGGTGHDAIVGSPWADTIGIANVIGNLDGIEAIDGGAGHDRIMLTDGDDLLDLSAIAVANIELINAGDGNDTLIGSTVADIFLGGQGQDTFVFRDGFAHDTVLDFEFGSGGATSHDVIEVAASSFADFDAILAAATDVNGDTVITFSGNDSVTLTGVSLQALTAEHFHIA